MAITKVSEWSTTPGSNTEIDGISLAEGVMVPSSVNNAMREHMSQIAEMYAGTTGDAWPVAAGGTGATSAAGALTNLSVGLATATLDTAADKVLFRDATDGKLKLDAFPTGSAATESTSGVSRFATAAELTTGTSDSLSLTPKKITEWQPATATLDTSADKVLFRDATDGKMKLDAFPASASGALIFIASQTASSSSSLDFTTGIDSTYDTYLFVGEDIVPATDNVQMYIRVSENSGGAWKSGASDYYSGGTLGAEVNSGGSIGNGANDSFSFTMPLFKPSGTARHKIMGGKGWGGGAAWRAAGSSVGEVTIRGAYIGTANAVNGVRFIMSSGNIASGTIRLYGVKKS